MASTSAPTSTRGFLGRHRRCVHFATAHSDVPITNSSPRAISSTPERGRVPKTIALTSDSKAAAPFLICRAGVRRLSFRV